VPAALQIILDCLRESPFPETMLDAEWSVGTRWGEVEKMFDKLDSYGKEVLDG
jgi:hypothetical protein